MPLPGRIMIHSVNNATSGPVVIAFTPSGEARDNSGASFPLSPMSCGTTYSSKPYAARIVYKASLRLTPPIFYQLEVNSFGEYRLCQSIGNYSFNETADSEVKSL